MAAYGGSLYGYGRYGYGLLVASGNAATGSVGSVAGLSNSVALTGVSSTVNIGAVGINIANQEDSVIATGNAGSVSASRSVAITGGSATGAVGTVGKAYGINGNLATGSLGTFTNSTTVAITTVSTTCSVGTVSTFVFKEVSVSGVSSDVAQGDAQLARTIEIIGEIAQFSVGNVGVFYWTKEADTAESWEPIADTSENWTPVSL